MNALYLKCRGRQPTAPKAKHRWTSAQYVHCLTQLGSYEAFQMLVSLIGVYSYIHYSINVNVEQFTNHDTGKVVTVYPLHFPRGYAELYEFIGTEVFVISSYCGDFLLRLMVAPTGGAFGAVFSFYGLVDLAAFAMVLFPNILKTEMILSPFLLGGILRIVRIRRALQHLDDLRGSTAVSFGPFTLTPKAGTLITLALNATLYVMCSAAIILAVEFPCPVIQPGSCEPALQKFYQNVYLIICTFSTVGYGDLSPQTPAGRALMILLILVMLVEVPIQINKFEDVVSDGDTQLDEMQSTLDRLALDLRRKFGIREPPKKLTNASKTTGGATLTGDSDNPHTWAKSVMAGAPEAVLRKVSEALGLRFTTRAAAAAQICTVLLGADGAAPHMHSRELGGGAINPIQRAALAAAKAGRPHREPSSGAL